ncbi:MAG TPA: hypothetical protein VFY43_06050, partial [Candidatus Limnocylindria bacterium]|nr:hypothetical protein [Candidatus Limnocylindria bacterium]
MWARASDAPRRPNDDPRWVCELEVDLTVLDLREAATRRALRVPGCLPPEQPAPHPGRYHRAGDPWPLYAALDRDTMWAEWRHATDPPPRPDDDPRWVCALEADLMVLDLRDP